MSHGEALVLRTELEQLRLEQRRGAGGATAAAGAAHATGNATAAADAIAAGGPGVAAAAGASPERLPRHIARARALSQLQRGPGDEAGAGAEAAARPLRVGTPSPPHAVSIRSQQWQRDAARNAARPR